MGLSLSLICTLFMGGGTSDTEVYLHQITFKESGYLSEDVKITSHWASLEEDPMPYEPDNEQVSQYIKTDQGMYIFNVQYEHVTVDDETLEADVTKANIGYVIDSKTMRFKETYIGTNLYNNPEPEPDINYGYCVKTHD